jgi:hypothetical protein
MKDNRERGRMGVVASVVKRPHGRMRLVFDDLERSASDWRTLGLYTWKEMSQRVFRSLKLTDKQLAEIGVALVVRLVALEKHSSSRPKKQRRRGTRENRGPSGS